MASQAPAPTIVVAVDFPATAVQKGRAVHQGLSGIAWQLCDIEAIPHRDGTFDTVISCETVEHVREPRAALSELARVLRPGRRLYLTTSNYLGPLGLYRIYLRLTGRRFSEVGQPINKCLLLPITRRWVAQAGLKVVKVDAIGHYVPFPGRPSIHLDFLSGPSWRGVTRWVALHSIIVAEKA